PQTMEEAARDITQAEAAFGTIPPEVLRAAGKLRWLQAPQAAPPAGFYYPELVTHPVVVTNFREIFNDHIGAHIMAFVLAFARDFPPLPAEEMAQGLGGTAARPGGGAPAGGDGVDPGRGRQRGGGGAARQGVRHARDRQGCPPYRQAPRRRRAVRTRGAR